MSWFEDFFKSKPTPQPVYEIGQQENLEKGRLKRELYEKVLHTITPDLQFTHEYERDKLGYSSHTTYSWFTRDGIEIKVEVHYHGYGGAMSYISVDGEPQFGYYQDDRIGDKLRKIRQAKVDETEISNLRQKLSLLE